MNPTRLRVSDTRDRRLPLSTRKDEQDRQRKANRKRCQEPGIPKRPAPADFWSPRFRLREHSRDRIAGVEAEGLGDRAHEAPRESVHLAVEEARLESLEGTVRNPRQGGQLLETNPAQFALPTQKTAYGLGSHGIGRKLPRRRVAPTGLPTQPSNPSEQAFLHRQAFST
jgi:hypothetical protein